MTSANTSLAVDKNLNYVRLDVGGYLYVCHRNTLAKYPNSTLSKYIAPEFDRRQSSQDFILIDRDGKHFGAIINYLRDSQSLQLGSWSLDNLTDLMREADYYCLEDLVELCEKQFELREKGETNSGAYQIPPSSHLEIIYGWKVMYELLRYAEKSVILICYKSIRKFGINDWVEDLLQLCDHKRFKIYAFTSGQNQPPNTPDLRHPDNFLITLYDPNEKMFKFSLPAPDLEKFRAKRANYKCKIYKFWFTIQNGCI